MKITFISLLALSSYSFSNDTHIENTLQNTTNKDYWEKVNTLSKRESQIGFPSLGKQKTVKLGNSKVNNDGSVEFNLKLPVGLKGVTFYTSNNFTSANLEDLEKQERIHLFTLRNLSSLPIGYLGEGLTHRDKNSFIEIAQDYILPTLPSNITILKGANKNLHIKKFGTQYDNIGKNYLRDLYKINNSYYRLWSTNFKISTTYTSIYLIKHNYSSTIQGSLSLPTSLMKESRSRVSLSANFDQVGSAGTVTY